MVHQVNLFKLKPSVTGPMLEEMMLDTRIQLTKIPEILSVKCGKGIDEQSDWPFFITLDLESMEKLAVVEDDPIYRKFMTDVIRANTVDQLKLMYEMEPGKNTKYS